MRKAWYLTTLFGFASLAGAAIASDPMPAPNTPKGASVRDVRLPHKILQFHPATPDEMAVINRIIQPEYDLNDPGGPHPTGYKVAFFDLNGDRKSEMVVEATGPSVCKPGCDFGILVRAKMDWRIIWYPWGGPVIAWKWPDHKNFAPIMTGTISGNGCWFGPAGDIEQGNYSCPSLRPDKLRQHPLS